MTWAQSLSCHTHHQPASTNSSKEFLILYILPFSNFQQRRRSARVEEINFEVSFISQMCTSVHVRNALFYMCMELNSHVYMCKHGEWWQAKIKTENNENKQYRSAATTGEEWRVKMRQPTLPCYFPCRPSSSSGLGGGKRARLSVARGYFQFVRVGAQQFRVLWKKDSRYVMQRKYPVYAQQS